MAAEREPARDAAAKALAALGHVRKPNERCTARYAEVPKEQRPPGPANAPVWCGLRAGHEGPHRCNHGGMTPSFVMRPGQTVMGDPLPDVCSKCGTRWPCPDAASVIAAMAQESGDE